MELLFIWLKKYKKLENQSFNFTDKYFFSFDYNREGDSILDVEENQDYIPNFFGFQIIKDISVIVGKNGSGKTTIFDFIKDNLVSANPIIRDEAVIIFRNMINDEEELLVLYHNKLKLRLSKILNSLKPKSITFDLMRSNVFDKWSIIFYSNIFDLKPEPEWEGLFNISTNYLLRNDWEFYTNDPKPLISENVAYTLSEIFRQVEFIVNFKTENITFDLPEYLLITPNDNDLKYIERDENELYKKIITFLEINESKNQTEMTSYREKYIYSVYKAAFYNFLKVYSISYSSQLIIEQFFGQQLIDNKTIIQNFFESLQNNSIYSEHVSNILLFLEYFEKVTNTNYFDKQLNMLKVPTEKTQLSFLNEFHKTYMKAVRINSYMDFYWNRPLSTGENSLLTIYSRFYSTISNVKRGHPKLKDNILLLIDEGDLYFHPEWQRTFLIDLMNLLNLFFYSKNIQIILATNTPYITSEVPKSKVIFTELMDDNNIVVLEKRNYKEETFSANIHTLLSNAFYLNHTIGEFARNKINSLIDYINDQKKDLNQKNEMKKLLNIISEPVIKKRIEEMWIDKFGKEDELELLRKRINEIEKNI